MENSTTSSTNQEPQHSVSGPFNYVRDLMATKPSGLAGRGVGAVIARTALKRLPPPLNFVVPMVVEKVILKHGAKEGRDLLLKGLRWVKKVTDEKPVQAV